MTKTQKTVLKRRQKLELLKWIAEGLSTGEINERAATFKPPFQVARQQVDYYRKTRALDLKAIEDIGEKSALTEGYATKETRVFKLSLLAALMESDLLGGLLWTEQLKGVGSGTAAQVVEYEEFNRAEVEAYRGVLDDIARELGGRKSSTQTLNIDLSQLSDEQLERIANGEDPLVVISTTSKG